MEIINSKTGAPSIADELTRAQVSRRKFFKYAGIFGASASVIGMAACNDKDDDDDNSVNLGSGDTGILNYAYALEQLEAAFYTQVVSNASFSANFSSDERTLLTDIRDHEIAHREFFKAALKTNAIPNLTVNFSTINFGDRANVLATAAAFEDLGVSAYNGAGPLLTSAENLGLAGKIVSVEARHAAWIRDRIAANGMNNSVAGSAAFVAASGSLAAVIDANAVEVSRTPSQVLAIAGTYISTKINASNLPS